MRNIKKVINPILISTLALVLASCLPKADGETSATWQTSEEETRTIAVEGFAVNTGFLVEEIRSAGVAEGIREAWVISETEGLIQERHFRLGDLVRAGETLLSIDNELAAQNRDLAEGQYETMRLEYLAAEQSKKNGSISALQFSQTADRLLAAKAALSTAIDAYENTYIKAPFAGIVASQSNGLGAGNYLTRGVRVARIVDYSAYRVEVSVGEGEVLQVQEGADVEVTGNDGLTRNGRVNAVSGGSDGSTGSFTVIVEWPPLANDRLKSGMSVDVAIQVGGGIEHIIAPASAIRVRGGEHFVFVDSNGQAESRRIDTGSRLGEWVEVFSGLDAGEVVITSGLASLTPGVPISTTVVGGDGENG